MGLLLSKTGRLKMASHSTEDAEESDFWDHHNQCVKIRLYVYDCDRELYKHLLDDILALVVSLICFATIK